jgi:hypothetical protein
VLPTTVFKTAAFDRSAISPGAKVVFFCFVQDVDIKKPWKVIIINGFRLHFYLLVFVSQKFYL